MAAAAYNQINSQERTCSSLGPIRSFLKVLHVSEKASVIIHHYPYLWVIQAVHEQHCLCCLVFLPWPDPPAGPRLYEDFARHTPDRWNLLKDYMDSSLPLIPSKLVYGMTARHWGGWRWPLCFEPFKSLQCGIKLHLPDPRVIQTHLHYTRCDPVMNQINIPPLRCMRYTSKTLPMKTLNASYLAGRAKEVRTSRNQNHKFKLSGIWNYFTESYILTAHSPNTLRCWHFHPD